MADAIVVGSGPNGLAAAIALAREGVSVHVVERAEVLGGGMRTAELTLPGFKHDVCSAIHPLAVGSPFLSTLPLEEHGVEWIWPPAALAHPFDDGRAALLERSPEETGVTLGEDAGRYARLMAPLVRDAPLLLEDLLGPVGRPRHPVALARFAARAALPATSFSRTAFRGERARGFFAGLAAHSMLPLSRSPTTGYGLMLGLLGHAVGWPLARGGSQTLGDGLASYLRSLGGTIETGRNVGSLGELDGADAVLLDVGPHQLAQLAGAAAPGALPAAGRGVSLRPGRLQARLGARRPDPVAGRGVRRAPRPFISAARSARSPSRNERRGGASRRARRSSCSPSRACSIQPGHRTAGTPPGRTATSRTARRST